VAINHPDKVPWAGIAPETRTRAQRAIETANCVIALGAHPSLYCLAELVRMGDTFELEIRAWKVSDLNEAREHEGPKGWAGRIRMDGCGVGLEQRIHTMLRSVPR